MTTTDVRKLSDEEVRVRVAELCGAKWYRSGGYLTYLFPTDPPNPLFREVERPQEITPQHLQYVPKLSLDWMHEAEKTLSAAQWGEYVGELDFIVRREGEHLPEWKEINPSRVIDALIAHATARQRAEAFILTMGGER